MPLPSRDCESSFLTFMALMLGKRSNSRRICRFNCSDTLLMTEASWPGLGPLNPWNLVTCSPVFHIGSDASTLATGHNRQNPARRKHS